MPDKSRKPVLRYISPMPRDWNIRLMIGEWYRLRETDKHLEAGHIPAWWDFTVNCGYSDKWYRCRRCDLCLGVYKLPPWNKGNNWGK